MEYDPVTPPELKPEEYPLAPDRVAARRGRRARRLGIAAMLLFTASLWFGESYLRYDLRETQYINALTLHNESARAVLRNVVRREGEEGGINATHLEALAAIEEDDLVLTRYQEAYLLNPNSWSLVLEYGTRLFLVNRLSEARERFREAGVQDPDNALPRYLEAAALALAENEEAALSEALAIIERTNIARSPVRFPQPAWHPSMPRSGAYYQRKQADIVDRCCAPLYRFKNLIEARVRADGQQNPSLWADWLKTVSAMGQRLVETSPESAPGQTAHAIAGLQIQHDMELLQRWLDGGPEPRVTEVQGQPVNATSDYRTALDTINRFEQGRAKNIEHVNALLWQPLGRFGATAAVLTAAILFISIAARVVRVRKYGREYAPPPWATWSQAAVLALIYLSALGLYSYFARSGAAPEYVGAVNLLWYGAAGTAFVLGLVAPVYFVPRGSTLVIPGQEAVPRWKVRWGAYLDLVQRTWEDQLAALIFAACAWFIFSRIMLGVYPSRLDLLVPAFEQETVAMLRQVVSQLPAPPG